MVLGIRFAVPKARRIKKNISVTAPQRRSVIRPSLSLRLRTRTWERSPSKGCLSHETRANTDMGAVMPR